MTKIDLSNRTAVVTGGASGIGKATAVLLAQHGAKVFIGDYRLDPANDEQFNELGIHQQTCDVRDVQAISSLVDGAVEQTGRLDILVNNAGIAMVKQIGDVSEDDWDNCLDTNLKAAFFGCKSAIPHMKNGGAIVNTASNAGLLPRAHDPVYSISKMSLVALTKSLALCHAGDRIRINCVCPGPVGDTGMVNADLDKAPDRQAEAKKFISASPLAAAYDRMISPQEVAESILYLVSDASVMVTGTSIAIDGGKSLGVPAK